MKQTEFLLNTLIGIGLFLLTGLVKVLGIWTVFGVKEIIVALLLFALSRASVHSALVKAPIDDWRNLPNARKRTLFLGGLIVIPGFLTVCVVLFSMAP